MFTLIINENSMSKEGRGEQRVERIRVNREEISERNAVIGKKLKDRIKRKDSRRKNRKEMARGEK